MLAELLQTPDFFKELAHTLLAWAVLFIVGIWMVICQQWSDMRWVRLVQNMDDTQVHAPWPTRLLLHDQVLDRLPVLKQAWISDKLVGTSVIFCILGCSVLAAGWRQRLMLIRRIAWMVAVLYFLRSITISVTTLPPSIDSCEIDVPQSMWQVILATPDILAGNIGQCTDKIFSGHTAILVISMLFWLRYATHWAFIAYSALHTILGIVSVLLARYHYTVDVLLGLVLTFFVHHLYYTALDLAIRQKDAEQKQRIAWSKFHPSRYQPHTPTTANVDRPEAMESGRDYYKMTVFRNTTANEGDLWRDHDSAVGDDIGSQSNSTTPVALSHNFRTAAAVAAPGQIPEVSDDPAFIMRKRETSSATALSIASEPSGHQIRFPFGPDGPYASSSPVQHEIAIADPVYAEGYPRHRYSDQHDMYLPLNPNGPVEVNQYYAYGIGGNEDSIGRQSRRGMFSTGSHRMNVMGINRYFGTFLPTVVAWMDGLDIRYNHGD
ncbi:hypothetical protein GGI07_002840 [Coemansia sp. Benny D115]|nr:hypothetical protein GGI07_002840 [Coemansia sp. Benny D115]